MYVYCTYMYMFMCIILYVFVITCLLYQGFKSRSLIVQLAAYEAWRVLIDDFALDPGEYMYMHCSCNVV